MSDLAISVKNLEKVYRLYDKPVDRLKESLSITHKQYHREHYALSNINFDVKKGETIGIIGTNGSGKSTLLKIITGVLNATKGNVEIKGRVSALLELGAGFNPEFTGIENIYLNGTMMGYTKEEISQRVESIVEFADIGEFVNQPVKTYSSGMFARLAFAVAINIDPDILIVDEALSVGDIFFQNKCFKKFEELQKKDTTILFVSHDMSSIKQMCSRVLWIEKGKQIAFDDKEVVCGMYLNEQISSMNKENKGMIKDTNGECKLTVSNEKKSYPRISMQNNSILSKDAEIISFFITDQENVITNQLDIGKEYNVHLVMKSNVDISNLILGFNFENNKGISIVGTNTYISKVDLNCKQGDIMECIFRFKLPKLMKGEYIFDAAIARGTQEVHTNISWVRGCYKVEINNEGYNISLLDVDSEVDIKKIEEDNIIIYENIG